MTVSCSERVDSPITALNVGGRSRAPRSRSVLGAGMLRKKTSSTRKAKSKAGQLLGNKGTATRLKLMAAARRLMSKTSPLSVTAAGVAKEAGTAAATFYVYFNDIEDILWALCDAIAQETTNLFVDESILRDDARLEEHALAFVRSYAEIWTRHGPLLLYRNLESDRGNARFNQLTLRIALPILGALTDRIVAASTPEKTITRGEANAEARVLARMLRRR